MKLMAPPDPVDRARLVREHYAGVYSLAWKLTRDDEAAREIAQETFARALTHLDQLDDAQRASSWLFKIATNIVRDRWRRKVRWESLEAAPAVESGAERILEKTEDLARARRALDTLPAETRAAMVLHLQEGLSIREIAFVLDVTENAARLKIYRGLQRVRSICAEAR